jgi:hypothetical protein
MAVLTQASPCMPIMPRFSGWEAGKPPMPSSVMATGICAFSANACTTASAPPRMMPWPARISGRSAALINCIGSPPLEWPGRANDSRSGAAASQSNSHVPSWASLVMSISTGPGRPLAAMANASRTADATSDARVTRKLCLVIGSVMPVMSVSWNASDPISVLPTCPVMQTIGDESIIAVAMPVTMLVAPGPDVATATPTLPVARA